MISYFGWFIFRIFSNLSSSFFRHIFQSFVSWIICQMLFACIVQIILKAELLLKFAAKTNQQNWRKIKKDKLWKHLKTSLGCPTILSTIVYFWKILSRFRRFDTIWWYKCSHMSSFLSLSENIFALLIEKFYQYSFSLLTPESPCVLWPWKIVDHFTNIKRVVKANCAVMKKWPCSSLLSF